MKDYDHIVVWLDYFNKNLKKSKGRRQCISKCVFDPSLKELIEAAGGAGFKVVDSDEKARFPRRPHIRSGYIVVPKQKDHPKTKMLEKISEKLILKRNKKR